MKIYYIKANLTEFTSALLENGFYASDSEK